MRRAFLCVAALVIILVSFTWASVEPLEQNGEAIVAVTPEQVKWFTPTYYTDGRERARLFGDSGSDGVWVDRVRIPPGRRVRAHTHPHDELATVIQGTWYIGAGSRFDDGKLKGYPAGSFIVIRAGVPHFVATREEPVIVQLNGTGTFGTDYVEK